MADMEEKDFKPKKIWVISELYYPEETSTGAFLTQTAEGLAGRFSVSVLCSQPTYGARGQRAPRNELRNGVDILRSWGTTFNKDVLPLRLINMATITISVMLNAIWHIRADDCVFVVTNPPTLPLVIALACGLRRAKGILIIHDVYPEVLIASGASSRGSFMTRAIEWVMRCLYRRMAGLVVLGRDMEALVRSKLPAGDDRITAISNWADLDLVKPLQRNDNAILKDLQLTEKFVIQYSGNIGRTHGIVDLIRCAQLLDNNSNNVHFLFIGFGGKKAWLSRTIREHEINNTTLLDYVPRAALPDSLNACDIVIISLAPGMTGVSVPSRMYNSMAAGKPIIAVADKASELARVVLEEGIGWVVKPGDVDALKSTIIDAQSNISRLGSMGLRARKAAEEKYSFKRANEKYMNLVSSLYQPNKV